MSSEPPGMMDAQFTVADYTLFILMLVGSLGIGVYSAARIRGKQTTIEYLLGGRSMPAFPIALSLLGGILSSVSILGNPTEVYLFGTQYSTFLLGCLPATLLIHQVLLPIFYNLKLVSLFQYINLRYKSPVLHKMTSLCMMLMMHAHIAVMLYIPSIALYTVTGLLPWASMLSMGLVCAFYISVGGVRAVVYTDVLQTLVMYSGVIVVVVLSCANLGGLQAVWTIAEKGSRIEFFNFDPSPFKRHTFWTTTVFGFQLMLILGGINSITYLRFASLPTLHTAQRLCLLTYAGIVGMGILSFVAGLVAYATYQTCDPLTSGRIRKPDQVIPYLVMDKLGHLPGLPGVFVATVYGSVLSTLSSSLNGMACQIWEDILKQRPYFASLSPAAATNVVKIISCVEGVLVTGLGLLMGELGPAMHVLNLISSALHAPIQGVMLGGVLLPGVNFKGAVAGFLTAFLYNLWVAVWKLQRGAGSPQRLPLSTEGCPLPVHNTTTEAYLLDFNETSTHVTTPATITITTTDRVEEGTLYDISYCYSGVIGILITFVVSLIVSFVQIP